MTIQEFPKILFLNGWDDLDAHKIVLDAEEEAQARKQGYRGLNEEKKAKKEAK